MLFSLIANVTYISSIHWLICYTYLRIFPTWYFEPHVTDLVRNRSSWYPQHIRQAIFAVYKYCGITILWVYRCRLKLCCVYVCTMMCKYLLLSMLHGHHVRAVFIFRWLNDQRGRVPFAVLPVLYRVLQSLQHTSRWKGPFARSSWL